MFRRKKTPVNSAAGNVAEKNKSKPKVVPDTCKRAMADGLSCPRGSRNRKKIFNYIDKHKSESEYLNASAGHRVEFNGNYMNGWNSLLEWSLKYANYTLSYFEKIGNNYLAEYHPEFAVDIALHLLECEGVDVNKCFIYGGELPLTMCLSNISKSPHMRPILNKLLSYPGIDVTICDNNGRFPLIRALEAHEPTLANLILQRGHHSQAVLTGALTFAMINGYSDTVKMLLDNPEFKIDPYSNEIITALVSACQKNHYDIIKLFTDKGLDIGVGIFQWATRNDHRDIMKTLLARDTFDSNTKLADGSTYLISAIACGNYWAAEKLLACRTKTNVNDSNLLGETALHSAAAAGFTECAALLLNHGADSTIDDNDGKTPLMCAAEHNKPEVVSLLLKWNNINVNAQDSKGDTALIHAARGHNNTEIIKDLMAYGANPLLQNIKCYTARMVAKQSHHDDSSAQLKSHEQQTTQFSPAPLSQLYLPPSAPPLELMEAELSQTRAAAEQPPAAFSSRGLFGSHVIATDNLHGDEKKPSAGAEMSTQTTFGKLK